VLALVGACSDDADTSSSDASATTAAAAGTTSTTATPEPVEHYPDHVGELYAGTTNWICHPDLAQDECRDLRTTVVAPDGTTTVDELAPATAPTFDCFYAYPTTSTDPGINSDLDADASERDTVRAQVARYASVCRVFAPVYRSITLGGLGAVGGGGESAEQPREIAYGDVLDAWRTYVDELGDGRGVVLIGHSQGAGLLRRLLEEEVAPRPELRDLLVSAVILGAAVPDGSLPGIPNCTSADEAGCLISYASYPADQPPADGAIFGRVPGASSEAVCVDPVALAGGDGLGDTVIPAAFTLLGGVDGAPVADTPFVGLPGAVRTACTTTGPYRYLAVSLAGGDDTRALDALLGERLGPAWGLHLLDANLVQDDLIAVVARQAEAHAAAG
jgi:hypothetical protein